MLGDKDTSFTSGCLCIPLGRLRLTHARLGITELLKTETYFGHAFCLFSQIVPLELVNSDISLFSKIKVSGNFALFVITL